MKRTTLDILHVDDDANDRMLLKSACRQTNVVANCDTVADGEQAIAYLAGENIYAERRLYPLPGVVLLDLKMPMKGGFEVLQWIRSQPNLKYLPVIIFTASKQDVDVKHAYDLGANAYVVKPNNMAGLVEAIRIIKAFWITFNETPD